MAPTRFTGRHALVTGAASGIGRATALRLASEGAHVMAVDVNAGALDKLEVDSSGLGGAITALVGDVSSEEGVIALVGASIAHLGALDVVVNVAGVLSFSHTHEVTLDEWSRLIAVNLTGTFLVCRESLPTCWPAGATSSTWPPPRPTRASPGPPPTWPRRAGSWP